MDNHALCAQRQNGHKDETSNQTEVLENSTFIGFIRLLQRLEINAI